MFGGTVWGNVMAVVVIISGIGALNGWTMICAEMPRAAAEDGVFPKSFNRLNRRGAPAFGIVVSTALASIAMIINYLGANGVTVFTTLVLMTGITAAIPYGFSAAAQIKWRIADQKKIETARFARDMIVAALSLIFSVLFIYYSRDTGHSFWVYWSPFLLTIAAFLVGVPVYRRQRNRMTAPTRSLPTGERRHPASPASTGSVRWSRSGATLSSNGESRSRPPTRPGRPAPRRGPRSGATRHTSS